MKNFILIILFCLTFITSSNASPSYSAQISVDVTDTNVASAKTKALAKARRDGLNDVVLSISTQQAVEELSKLNDNQIQHFIKEVQILMEKSSTIRYIADLKIEINEDVLKSYLSENNLPISISQTPDILIIPMLEKLDKTINLWTSENTLYQDLLDSRNLKSNTANFYIIEKNLGNITAIDPKHLFDMNEKKFKELSTFNKVDKIAIVKYCQIHKRAIIKIFPENKLIEEDLPLLDDKTERIETILNIIKGDTKKSPAPKISSNETQTLNIIYTYDNLSSWTKLKKTLEENQLIDNITVISMVNKKVHFNFTYTGFIEKLQIDLSNNGYNLKNNGEYYVIN